MIRRSETPCQYATLCDYARAGSVGGAGLVGISSERSDDSDATQATVPAFPCSHANFDWCRCVSRKAVHLGASELLDEDGCLVELPSTQGCRV